ncbi:RlpA-like double-psi beta-barrel domain protein [Kalmanozyma brasiliensis GHG001]|uniref:RlpA-like protein double-psi beta-barrel domain-containing protein n=1 Tax=Kalmanozyma brasiliensis (strain GHG001) TaxID=1365824 RepID=V5EUU1_KALBG|nr:RlpA-like double-psi beta-barrel domain protein [Kalmanozyma brasiliensis GHG001]EST09155.1 RlpA-like double-psi beta-barrel domain protein [Kalmanozyma brasiliensis GHG001]
MTQIRRLLTLLVVATSLVLVPSATADLVDNSNELPSIINDAAPAHLADSLAAYSQPRIPINAEQSAKKVRRHHKSRSGAHVSGGKATYYAGHQLDNPACPGATTPNDSSMIAAISDDSPFACGDQLRIKDPNGKEATVHVVDKCAGCTSNWLDVTKGVFTKFDSLDKGVLEGLEISKVG